MNKKIFVIFDSKVGAYLQPFFLRSTGEAIRSVTELACDKNHQFNRHAGDFSLFECGEFDESTCMFYLHDAPRCVGHMVEYRSTPENLTDEPIQIPAFLKNQAN